MLDAKVLTGDFNNRRGGLQEIMREDGDDHTNTIHLASKITKATKNFDGTVNPHGKK